MYTLQKLCTLSTKQKHNLRMLALCPVCLANPKMLPRAVSCVQPVVQDPITVLQQIFDKHCRYENVTDVSKIVEASLRTPCCASPGAGTAGCHTFGRSLDHGSCMSRLDRHSELCFDQIELATQSQNCDSHTTRLCLSIAGHGLRNLIKSCWYLKRLTDISMLVWVQICCDRDICMCTS